MYIEARVPSGYLHVQERVETPAGQPVAKLLKRAYSLLFIENDELDAWNILNQAGLNPTDNPGDFGLRPGLLNGPEHREGVTDVSNGRKAQQANILSHVHIRAGTAAITPGNALCAP